MFLLLFAGSAALIAPTVALDIYGVFRNVHGRHLTVYKNEREAKYLLNQRYVPENFDALLIGSSTTGNWDTSRIKPFRVYNDSLDGGNAAEERILVTQALRRGDYRLAIVLIHPYFTVTHQLFDAGMGPVEWREALGSINLLDEYNMMRKIALHRVIQLNHWYGAKDLVEPIRLPEQSAIEYIYKIDPEALRDYRSIIDLLRTRGIPIVFVMPPMYEPMRRVNEGKLQAYYDAVDVLKPGDMVIDFNGPEYLSFRQQRDNFSDGIHATAKGSEQISSMLNQQIGTLLEQSRLAP